jgi:hypothetical protein
LVKRGLDIAEDMAMLDMMTNFMPSCTVLITDMPCLGATAGVKPSQPTHELMIYFMLGLSSLILKGKAAVLRTY